MTLEHPHVIQLFQVTGTLKNIYIMMEHAGGLQLFHHITRGSMQKEEAQRHFRQIVCAMGCCHENSIVHGDLKVENIMVNTRGHIKLVDFGFSTKFTAGWTLYKFWGTLPSLTPEIVLWQSFRILC